MDFLFPTLVPLVAFLMVLIIAFTYIGGKVFRVPEWEAYFNIELHNLVFAIIIIASAFAVFEGSKALAYSMLGAEPVEASQAFLNKVINRGVLPMYKDLLGIEAGAALSNSFYMKIGPGVWSFTLKIQPGMDAILSMTRVLSMGLLAIYGSLSVQYILLSFVNFGMPIALSIGILLFIFPPTREAGAFLMSLAFGFQVVFPFLYALNGVILNDMTCARNDMAPMCGMSYEAYVPEFHGVQMRGISGLLASMSPLAPAVIPTLSFQALVPFINAMAHLALVSLFLPALSITLTVAFINAITKYLLGKT